MYRKDIFQEYGLSEPKSFDDIERAAKTVSEKSSKKIAGITMRGQQGIQGVYVWAAYLWGFGGSFLDPQGKSAGSVANLGSRRTGSQLSTISGGGSEQAGNEGGLRRHVPTADVVNLPLPDHRHCLVASQCRLGCSHAAKPKPWPDHPFDAPVVLLDDVVQVFALSQP